MISGAVGPGDHDLNKSSIWHVSILGGEPRKLRGGAFRATLSPDDSRVAYMSERGISLADADGENPREFVVAEPGEFLGSPEWSSDSERVIYRRAAWGADGLVTTIESRGLDDEASIVLVRDERPTGRMKNVPRVWSKDFLMVRDRLVYSKVEPAPRNRDLNLWEIDVDPGSGKPIGEPRRLTDWVGFNLAGLSATADGSRLVFGNDRGQQDVYVGRLPDGGSSLDNPRRLTLDDRDDLPACWTPDGRAVVFRSDRNGSQDLLAQSLDERSAEDLVIGAGDQSDPHLTPDGESYLYWELQEDASEMVGSRRLLRVPVGGGPTELVLEVQGFAGVACATKPDGPCLLFELRLAESIGVASRLDPVEGKGDELWRWNVDLTVRPSTALSPDGSRLAMVAHTKEARSIRLMDALTGEVVRDVDVNGVPGVELNSVAWSPDGNGLYLIAESSRGVALLRADLEGRAKVLHEDPTADFFSPKPSPDGRHLAFGKLTWDTNVWMIEDF